GKHLAGVLCLLAVVLPADEPLHGEDRVHRVGDRLPLRDLSDEALAVLSESDDGRRRAAALAVRQDLRRGALDHRDAAVRRAEVDAQDLAHAASLVPRRTSRSRHDRPGPGLPLSVLSPLRTETL